MVSSLRCGNVGVKVLALSALFSVLPSAPAADWPQWMGPERDGVWREQGILDRFPTNGLTVRWRVPVNRGYCGPVVAGDRVFLLDRPKTETSSSLPAATASERVLCLDANSGSNVWERSYACEYRIAYPSGPRATPVIAAGRLYTLGAMGDLLCLDARDGKVIWERHFLKDFGLKAPPVWGYAAHPLLDGDRLICLVGGSNSAVVAFHKDTGKELWRALTAVEIGYAAPVIQMIGGRRQLLVWHPDAVAGLEPESGKVLWTQPYPVEGEPQRPEVTVAMPRVFGDNVFVSTFYHGALLLKVTGDPPGASVVWNRFSKNLSKLDEGLHTVMCVPIYKEGYLYGVCGMGELRCLDARTGDRVWQSDAAVGGNLGLFGHAFLIQREDRVFIWNDQGELILARLTPKGCETISRAKLLETSERTRGRDILWCHPAFANRCLYAHNGKEFICVSLAAPSPA